MGVAEDLSGLVVPIGIDRGGERFLRIGERQHRLEPLLDQLGRGPLDGGDVGVHRRSNPTAAPAFADLRYVRLQQYVGIRQQLGGTLATRRVGRVPPRSTALRTLDDNLLIRPGSSSRRLPAMRLPARTIPLVSIIGARCQENAFSPCKRHFLRARSEHGE
jgi:hypothetical protein